MTRNRIRGIGVLFLVALVFGGGCVAQSELKKQRALSRKAQEQVGNLQRRLAKAKDDLAALRGGNQQDQVQAQKLTKQLEDARSKVRSLRSALNQARSALSQSQAGPGELSPELASQLQTLASNNPQLMTFDADRKMVRLKSDLTFALGSTKVKTRAKKSLARLAEVLQNNQANQFEVRVVGHTDNVPVTNPANKRKYEDNWGLSAFRAKAVMEEMAANGVSQKRMSIAGYGASQPVVPNPKRGGAEPNRRVEIFLVPPYDIEQSTSQDQPANKQAQQTGNQNGSQTTGQNQSNQTQPGTPQNKGPSNNTNQNQSEQTSPDERPIHFK